jgi:hypothetical protein
MHTVPVPSPIYGASTQGGHCEALSVSGFSRPWDRNISTVPRAGIQWILLGGGRVLGKQYLLAVPTTERRCCCLGVERHGEPPDAQAPLCFASSAKIPTGA